MFLLLIGGLTPNSCDMYLKGKLSSYNEKFTKEL